MGIPVGNIVQVRFDYLLHGQQLMNVLHYRVTNSGTGTFVADQIAIQGHFDDAATPNRPLERIKSVISSSVDIVGVRTQVVYPVRYAFLYSPLVDAGALGESLYSNTDVVVTKRAALAGRRYRSNIYLPGVPDENTLNGVLIPGYKTAVQTAMQWLEADVTFAATGLNLEPIIWSPTYLTGARIENREVQPEVRVMTRRTVGRGI